MRLERLRNELIATRAELLSTLHSGLRELVFDSCCEHSCFISPTHEHTVYRANYTRVVLQSDSFRRHRPKNPARSGIAELSALRRAYWASPVRAYWAGPVRFP